MFLDAVSIVHRFYFIARLFSAGSLFPYLESLCSGFLYGMNSRLLRSAIIIKSSLKENICFGNKYRTHSVLKYSSQRIEEEPILIKKSVLKDSVSWTKNFQGLKGQGTHALELSGATVNLLFGVEIAI